VKFFERPLTPRGYEMNSTGSVSTATIARYAEHVRWDGLRDSDFGLSRLWQRGVIRAQRIQTYKPVHYGHELVVRMWVSRVGRTSFDLAQTITRAHDQTLVARLAVTVVNLGSDGRPSPLDPGMTDFVVDEPLPEVEPPSEEPPAGAFAREIVVTPSDQDLLQHVNHARYIDYIEDTRWFAQAASTASAYTATPPEQAQNARRVAIDYDEQATFGERLTVLTWSGQIPGFYEFRIQRSRDGQVLSRARVSLA
jgi:YbgC/YbaW family acyl-CoA thioester hydrolase